MLVVNVQYFSYAYEGGREHMGAAGVGEKKKEKKKMRGGKEQSERLSVLMVDVLFGT